ncbi:MAG: hypothetical protein JWP55_4668 [Mycobacterium sp.]|nr:hypothetical protein [Mycobacterium sp.]
MPHHVDIRRQIRRQFGIAESEQQIRPVKDLLLVFFGYTHHVAYHLQRQRAGEVSDEFAFAVRVFVHHGRHQVACAIANGLFSERKHLGCERPADD